MKKKREGRTLLQSDFCTHAQHAHIHKPTKSFLNLALLIAFGLAEWCSEWRDHPSAKGLLVQTLMSVIICSAVVSLSTVSEPSSSS